MGKVGPGVQQQQIVERGSQLDGANEYEYVTVFNPLSDDFVAKVAQSKPIPIEFQVKKPTQNIQDASDIRREYGLNLKNPDHTSKQHITNTVVIRAGQSINLPGNEAQVVVRQIVNEMLQREGQKLLMADPKLRKEAEDRVIKARGSMDELMNTAIRTPEQQMQEALEQSNKVNEVGDEPEFPDVDPERSAGASEAKDSTGSADKPSESGSDVQPKKKAKS